MDDRIHDAIREWWDADAAVYDDSAGHALTDPVEATAWREALAALLPSPPAAVLDVGAGTGAMSLEAAALGHRVTALDLSDGMLAVAERKAAARDADVTFVRGPAGSPPTGPFDAVMERHVLWTLPDPVAALGAWRGATAPGGTLACFEGSWAGDGPWVPVTDALAALVHRLRGTSGGDHHAPYPEEILHAAPLSELRSPRPFLDAVEAAGWRDPRCYRLRAIERAISTRAGWPLGTLERRTRYAIVATAPG